MGRRIVSVQYQSGGGKAQVDSYFDRVLKYIPADVVGAWLTVNGLIQSAGDDVPKSGLLWLSFVLGLVATAWWTLGQTQDPKKKPARTQTIIATGAFGVWIFALGGPFATLSFYRPLYGSLLLIFYTLFVARIDPPEK
ncbi:MAG: hypothetical protein SWY16_26045 [Cyanobacteriota bacterium]|nr:hypothetical protein [Cyanobacteriota bacterium]